MSLKTLLASIKGKTILTPILQDFIAKQNRLVLKGKISKKTGVVKDAKLTIKAMKERIKEFNHGEDPEGEFFHPSALGGCLRRTWFAAKGADPEPRAKADELRDHFVFEVGTAFHTLLQNLIERAGIMEAREVAIMDVKEKILGHCDVVIEVEGVRYVVEIKTINLRGFASVAKQPQHAHKIQAHAYMKPLKADWAIILYYCKETSAVREHVIQFDPKFYKQWVRDRIDGYFQKVRKNVLPEREESTACSYCPFAGLCFSKPHLEKFMKGVQKGTIKKKTKLKDLMALLLKD